MNCAPRVAEKIVSRYIIAPHVGEETRKLLGLDTAPSLMKILNENTAFSLRVNHPVFDDIYPVNPNSVTVAGLQTRPAKTIQEKSVRKWLDGAKNGAIFVSFGSVSLKFIPHIYMYICMYPAIFHCLGYNRE
jgi:hypothetical protein